MATLIKAAYCCLLLVFLLLPSLGMVLDFEDYPSCEKRELAPLPEFQFSKKFLNDFEDYYNDHFSFRNQLNHWNAFFKYTFLRSSPKPQDAVIGQEDWFYYIANNTLQSFARTNLLSESALAQEVQTWTKRKAKLDSLGIQYHQAVFPNKSTIYTAYLPAQMASQKRDTFSKIDQVLQYLETQKIPLEIIDVRKKLFSQKDKQRIYHKHDTHWNSFGAFFAYQQVIQTMGITPYQLDDFDITWEETTKGDLLEIAGLCNSDQIKEMRPVFTLKNKDHELRKVKANWMRRMENDFTDSEQMIIVFRDSYTTALIPFISLHFRQSNFIWSDYDQKFVDDMKPDVVLVAKVERFF